MKTLHSLSNEAAAKRELWKAIASDSAALHDRGVSKEYARRMVSYFDGRYDGLWDAMRMFKGE